MRPNARLNVWLNARLNANFAAHSASYFLFNLLIFSLKRHFSINVSRTFLCPHHTTSTFLPLLPLPNMLSNPLYTLAVLFLVILSPPNSSFRLSVTYHTHQFGPFQPCNLVPYIIFFSFLLSSSFLHPSSPRSANYFIPPLTIPIMLQTPTPAYLHFCVIHSSTGLSHSPVQVSPSSFKSNILPHIPHTLPST